MNTQTIDKQQLKEVIWELIQENPDFFKNMIRELIETKEALQTENRDEKVKNMILKDIAKYRKVWEALA